MTKPRHIDAFALTVTLLPILPIAWDTWGILYYRQGLRNEPMDLAPGAMTVAIVTSFAIAILLVRTWHLHKSGDSRSTLCWFMFVLALMVWPAVLIANPRPVELYSRGLVDWARKSVDAEAIRSAGDPATLLQPLHADRIERTPNGVILQWGRYAIMPGKMRKLFIGDAPNANPPDEGRDFWRPVSPGVFVGTHGRR